MNQGLPPIKLGSGTSSPYLVLHLKAPTRAATRAATRTVTEILAVHITVSLESDEGQLLLQQLLALRVMTVIEIVSIGMASLRYEFVIGRT